MMQNNGEKILNRKLEIYEGDPKITGN